MSAATHWHDLGPRVITGLVLIAIGVTAIWVGGLAFRCFVAVSLAAMVWEIVVMFMQAPSRKALVVVPLGVLVAMLPTLPGLCALILLVCVGAILADNNRRLAGASIVFVGLAAFGLLGLRSDAGSFWFLWLAAVIVVTDIAGYFIGRTFGGPLFWPRISPKKTWSGTAGGWIFAGVVGGVFMAVGNAGPGIALISVLVSMASQAGDLAESAVKRRAGVKDASALLPGHGGVLDRFDGFMGAAFFMLLLDIAIRFPP